MSYTRLLATVLLAVSCTLTTHAAEPAIKTTTISQEGSTVKIDITTANASDQRYVLVFFDTDKNDSTGFNPPARPGSGYDMLIQGEMLYSHDNSGGDRSAWTWKNLGNIKMSADGDTLHLALDVSQLNSGEIGVSVWQMSEDWMSLLSTWPAAPEREHSIKLDCDAQAAPATQQSSVPFSDPRPRAQLPVRQRAQQAENFYCYYGVNRAAELSHYDLLVLESRQQKRADIEKLRANGSVVVAYLTVGEDDKLRDGDGTGPGGKASWYFDKDNDGQADKNGIWNSYYANAADPNWRTDRLEEARRLIESEGYDGVFLDTLDTPVLYPDSADGMVQLVGSLRENFPDKAIILNQGFTQFHKLGPLGDAVMIESFTTSFNFETKTYFTHPPHGLDGTRGTVQRFLLPVLKSHRIPVLSLEYAKPDDAAGIQTAYDRNATFGFLTAIAPIFLDDVYHVDATPRPDAKYLGKLANPETLSWTMPNAANGLPAGTKLVPSGTFLGYGLEPLVDGIEDRADLHWSKAAWASNEDGEETWLEIRLPEPRSGGTLKVSFADYAVSRDYTIQVKHSPNDAWTDVHKVTGNTSAVVTHELPQAAYSVIRLHQSPGGGSPSRPDLLWLAQIELESNR